MPGDLEATRRQHETADVQIQTAADLQIQRVVHARQRRAAHWRDAVPVQFGRRRTAVGYVVEQIQFPHVQRKAARETIHRHQTHVRRNTRPTARRRRCRIFTDNGQIQTRASDPEAHRIGGVQARDDIVAIPGEGAVDTHEQVHIAQAYRQQRSIR